MRCICHAVRCMHVPRPTHQKVELGRARKYLLYEALTDVKQKWAYDGDHLIYTDDLINNKKEHESVVMRTITKEKEEKVLPHTQPATSVTAGRGCTDRAFGS